MDVSLDDFSGSKDQCVTSPLGFSLSTICCGHAAPMSIQRLMRSVSALESAGFFFGISAFSPAASGTIIV